MLFSNITLPRWFIFLVDILIVGFSVLLAYLLRFNFQVPDIEIQQWPLVFSLIIGVRALSFIIARTYAGIIQYTSTEDAIRISLVVFSGSALFSVLNILFYYYINGTFIIPFSVIIMEFITVIFAMVTFRIVVKLAYLEITNPSGSRTKVILYGAGEAGIIAKRVLDRDIGTKYRVLAYIDDDRSKWGKKIEGVNIYGFEKLAGLLENNTVDTVIISIQKLSPAKKQSIVDLCLDFNTKVMSVPPVTTWINGQLSFKQIKNIKIEDLLEREEIRINTDKIADEIAGRTVMITGASGSIGSELVRQIISFNPKKLVLIDQAESAMFDLEVELNDKFEGKPFEIAIADICNPTRMEHAFQTFRPQMVYHAAAYKHVPMMENNPSEALMTNIQGTKILADLSVKYEVEKFIMISTDKAVNPTNVMGASKRIAEIYTQSINGTGKTRFITTRFGNVLGSNGSAVNLFRKQIANGGPVTVTHPEVIRYFMTIPEACLLVLEAGSMGKGGEIYLFDMGKPVKILDLAHKMIRLSGLEIDKDIQIKFTGLRPGEKLYEELLNDEENVVPTHHPQIMAGKVRAYSFEEIGKEIIALIGMFDAQDNTAIVAKMKKIVPEFISNNSVYEQLDNA
ncbi:MAG: polysaccharide biosynthesis protein [Bacteroidales bacterium]|nr:polysaccharide biosynthesis protein [Bacteroidales bacterium]